jgi:hypothetical protein
LLQPFFAFAAALNTSLRGHVGASAAAQAVCLTQIVWFDRFAVAGRSNQSIALDVDDSAASALFELTCTAKSGFRTMQLSCRQ